MKIIEWNIGIWHLLLLALTAYFRYTKQNYGFALAGIGALAFFWMMREEVEIR